MSSQNPPAYHEVPPSRLRSPTYTVSPQANEFRVALNVSARSPRPPYEFVKRTKSGSVSLILWGQDGQAPLPVYGPGASVQGTVDIPKTGGVTSVEVQVS